LYDYIEAEIKCKIIEKWEDKMNQFRRFMYGRYGFDQYSRTLIVISLSLSIIVMTITRFTPIYILAYIPLIYAIYRALSKNISKRSMENMIYLNIAGSARKKMNQLKLNLVGTKTHKYYKCSNCKQIIRVPRGKGKICITCPKCKSEFFKRT
jgi:DNA-directed RNA polymerase subunit RPC12/RpoP